VARKISKKSNQLVRCLEAWRIPILTCADSSCMTNLEGVVREAPAFFVWNCSSPSNSPQVLTTWPFHSLFSILTHIRVTIMAGTGGAGEFGNWEDDAQKALSIAKASGELLGQAAQPLLDRRAQSEAERKLEERLGEWAKEARRNGQWHLPMLRLEKFEEHRDVNKGYFNPTGAVTSNFGWAHLLYALNIRPGSVLADGRAIIDWKLPTGSASPVETGDIHLEMPAEVLWHIINIYRLYSEPDLRRANENHQTRPRYRLPFGTLIVKVADDLVVADFEPKLPTTKDAKVTNSPFSIIKHSPRGGDRLLFKQDEVMTAYLVAIASGISRSDLAFTDSANLDERMKELVVRLKALRSSPWTSPYLLTGEWLEQASRIYRRVTTDTGQYLNLPDDIVSAMKTKPVIIELIQSIFGEDGGWEEIAQKVIRGRVLYPGHNLYLVWGSRSSLPIKEAVLSQYIDRELPSILNSFSDKPVGSLAHILSEMQDEACYLLTASTSGPEIRNTPGIVLEFTPAHKLWSSDCFVN
jgi:hypothetical protein